MTASITFLLFAGILTISNGLPNTFQCARYCKEFENTTFGYEAGQTYTYIYKGDVRSLINSTYENVDESGVKIEFLVDIHPISTCEFAMQIYSASNEEYHIKNTVITTQKSQIQELENNPLYFSYHNGKIATICPDGEDSAEILNVKKAVLSVFQNSMQDLDKHTLVYETDITGTCETTYKVLSNENKETIVEKTKNLNACSHRMYQYLSWQSVPYATNFQAKSLPLLRSDLTCTQKYNNLNILSSSSCKEKHVFQPFSHGDNGAVTMIKQEMTLLNGLHSNNPTNKFNLKSPRNVKRTSLAYEASDEQSPEVDVSRALELISELEKKTADGVDADVPKIFSKLVFDFQSMDQAELLNVFKNIKENNRKFFIDAISLVTTTSGIEVMKQLYSNKMVTKKQIDSWIISLSFIKHPTLETITAVQPLMKMDTTRQNTILAVSSIIYRYCKKDGNCLDRDPILQAIKDIEEPLENNCKARSAAENNDILLSLKGLGNAGVTTSFNLLQSCYINDNLPIELRLAAIAAHRRMSCVRNFNLDDFKNYFANPRENTEIRIASYLATMQCASYAVFAQVKDVLMKEEINQIGSFVWTHITNLQETSVQWKQGIKKLLENEFLKNKFNTDIRKYSRNYEASTFFDSMGVGGAVESNVIFTGESYLPRSAMLNFTLDLFGETINVFEAGARLEGFEEIVENFFGPEGYFTDKSIKTFLENVRQTHSETNDKITELGNNFRTQKVLDKEPAGLLYAKIFGNEFSYTHFKTLQELIGDPIAADRAIDFFLNLFRENDIEYTKSFIFLDSSYKIPTIIGLPLELVANGTATLGLTVKGKLDLKDLWSYKMAIEGKIYPSAAMEVVGTMSVGTFGGRTGVKYVGQMNTNTYIDGHAFINSGKIVDLKINMPKKQMDIISVTSDVFILHNQEVYKIQDVTDNIEDKKMCTQKLFSAVTGLQICHQMRYVNASEVVTAPYFPLTGSFKYSMHIKKTDTFDSYQLHLKTQVEEQTTRPLYSMSLYLDTPNSLINRKIQASYRLNLETLSLNAKLNSPFTSFEINSNIGKESNKYNFQLETLYNDKEIISLKSTFNINHAGYDSLAKLKYQQIQIAAVSGSLKYLHTGKYAADLKLEGVTGDPIGIIGDLIFDPNSISVKSSLSSKAFRGDLQWQLKVDQDGVIVTSNLDYNVNAKTEKMTFLLQMNKLQFEHNIIVRFENTHAPMYDLLIDFKNEREPWFYKNYMRVTFFETTWRTEQQFKFRKDKALVDFDTHAYIKCEEKSIDYQLLLLYNTSKLHYKAHALIQLNKIQRIEGSVNYQNNEPEETIHALVYYPRQSWEIDGLLRRESAENYYLKFNGFRTTNGTERKFIEITGDYTNSSVDYIQDHKINCTMDLPESNGRWATPWIITASFQKSRDVFLSFSQLKTRNEVYVGHMNWMDDNFAFIIQANGKRLFVANAAQNNDILTVLLALNVYQHFELSSRLVLPYNKFDLKFYWDKDRDETQKFVFGVEKNVYKGLYNMEVEYPNQKVTAAFVLLPTQVTMNVTWGIQVSQRIYLKVGNKIYDVGGIWFGELETPFQYLEKQEFQLKYYIVAKSFEVQSDISWRHQSIHLLVSGSKLNEHLTAVIQLNTTLPEISKVGAAMTHTHQSDDNYKTDATFVYNEHQVTAQSNWKINGLQVNSNFRVESSSNTIQPIAGILIVNSNDTNNLLLELYWQAKSLKVESSFKSDTSSIKINTPFEGFENTTLKYSVKAYPDKVLLKVTVDLLGQYNNVYLRWSNLDDSMEFWMDLVSPVTGYYSLQFTHSTVLGILKESFTIKGHEQKDIILVSLDGYIVSLSEMNLVTFLKLLEHKAMLTIEHKSDPISSVVRATWDEFIIESSCSIGFDTQNINEFNWVITTNALPDENIEIDYFHNNENYNFLMKLPKHYSLTNQLYMAPNYEFVENIFRLKTSGTSVNLDYKHKNSAVIFVQNLNANYLNRRLDYNFTYSVETNPTLNVNLTLPYDANDHITFITQAKSESFESAEFKFYEKTGRVPIEIAFSADAKSPRLTVNLFVRKSESTLNVSSASYNFDHSGEYLLNSVTTGDYFNKYLNANVKSVYSFDQNKALVVFDVLYNKESYNLDVKLSKSYIFSLDVILKQNQEKLLALELAINRSRGDAFFIYNSKSLRVNYLLNDRNCLELNAGIRSNIKLIPNCTLNASLTEDKNLYIDLEAGNSNFITNASYSLNVDNHNQFTAELDGYIFVDYTKQDKKILDLDLLLLGKAEASKTNGKILMDVKTNLVKTNNVELTADYNTDKGYEATVGYKQNSEVYKIEFNNFRQSDAFEISTQIIAPNLGLVKLEINTLKKYNEYTTQFILTVNNNVYAADVITTYVSYLDFASRFQINLPDKYAGNFEIKLNELQLLLNSTLKAPNDSFNKATLNWKSGYIFGTIQLHSLIPEHNLVVTYNLNHPVRSFTANLLKERDPLYTLTGEVTLTKLNVRLDYGNLKDYIVMGGNHKFNSLRDFSISYGLFKDGNRFKIDLLNYFGEIYQTKLDFSTHIRGWSRVTLESKIDDEKIRISLNARNHHMSLVAKKYTPKGDEILSIKFQGETLLEIWSEAGQMTLRTSSRFGQYRLFLQCTETPGIYGFSILKNGENLISIMLQNYTTEFHINFKGKIIAPELLTHYSNLSLTFDADYNLAKSMQFNIFNNDVNLIGIKWFTKVLPEGYRGYFKFNSLLEFLENLEIHPSLEIGSDFVLSTRLVMSSKNNRKEYFAFLLLPGKNQKTKLSVVYPCEMYQSCNFYFVLEPRNLDFHWSTPFESWKNVSLKANLQYNNGTSLGLFKIKNVKSNFDLGWMYELKENSILGNFSTHNNFRKKYFRNLEVNGKYSFYKSLRLNYSVEGFPGTFQAEFVNELVAKSFKIQNKGHGINLRLISVVSYNEDAHCSLEINNRTIATFTKGKINGKSHTQFFKIKYFEHKSDIYYNLASELASFGIDFQGVLNGTLTVKKDISSGNGNLVIHSLKSNNQLIWSSNLFKPDISIDFTHNNHTTKIKLDHLVEQSAINSSLIINCGGRGMELYLIGEIVNANELSGTFILKTPLDTLKDVKLNAVLRHNKNNYNVYYILAWQQQYMTLSSTAALNTNAKILKLDFDSSFTKSLKSNVEFKRNGDQIHFNFGTEAGEKFIQLKSLIVQGLRLSGNLTTTFVGYKTCNVTSEIDKEAGTASTKISKENLTLEMLGKFLKSNDNYEMNMQVNYPDGAQDVGTAFLKFNNNNFNASLKFVNNDVKMDFGLDNNLYKIYMQSPYEYAKEINLKGIYTNNVNIYSLETDGKWNELSIDFNGILKLYPDNHEISLFGNAGDSQGKLNLNYKKSNFIKTLNFEAYFPKPETATYLKFEADTTNTSFTFKSPFQELSELQIKSTFLPYEMLEIDVFGNIQDTPVFSRVKGSMDASSINAYFSLDGFATSRIYITIKADENEGALNINQEQRENYNNIHLNYTFVPNKFLSNFILTSTRYNTSHTLSLLYKNDPEIEYGIILNDCEVIESIQLTSAEIKSKLYVSVPYYKIKTGFLLNKRNKVARQAYTEAKLFYNNNEIEAQLNDNENIMKLKINYALPNTFNNGTINSILEKRNEGFTIVIKHNSELYSDNLTTTYLNNETVFELTLKSNNHHAEFYCNKTLENIRVDITNILKVELENGERSKLFFLLKNHAIEAELNTNAILIKVNSPLISQKALEIILNAFTESTYKQFKLYYKENNVQAYKALFTFEHSKENYYVANIDLHKVFTRVINLKATLQSEDYVCAFVTLKAYGELHTGNLTLNVNQPYVAYVDLSSPYLKHNRYTMQIEATTLKTITFYVSSGNASLENYVLFQSIFQENTMKVDLQIPRFHFLRLFKLMLEWDFEVNNTSQNYLEIRSDKLGHVLAQADFILLKNLLDIETHFRIPFLKNFEEFDSKVYIPTEFRPKIEFKLPNNVTYSLHFNHSISEEHIFIDAGYECITNKFNVIFDYSSKQSLEFELITPSMLEYISVSLTPLIYTIDINHKIHKFTYNYKNLENHKLLQAILETPFENYKEYSLDFEYKSGSENKIKFLIFSPNHKKIGLNFGFEFANLLLFTLNYNIYTPYSIRGFDFLEIHIVNELNSTKFYTVEYSARTNNYNLTLNMGTINTVSFNEILVDSNLNNEKLYARFQLLGKSWDDFKLLIHLETPIDYLSNFKATLDSFTDFPKLHHKDFLKISYKNRSIINSKLLIEKNTVSFNTLNIWRSFSIDYKYLRDYKSLDALGKICWDLDKVEQSQIGARLSLDNNLSSALYLPNNTFTFDAVTEKDEIHESYYWKASWNENDISMETAVTNLTTPEEIHINTRAYLQLPFRTFKVIQNIDVLLEKTPEVNSTVEYIWGDEVTSKLILKNEILQGKLTSRLITKALDHEVSLKLDMSKFNCIPSIITAEFEYSDDPEKLLQFEIYYNKNLEDGFATERNFIFKHLASKIDYELYFYALRRSNFSNGSIVLKYRNFDLISDTPESIRASVKVDHDKFGVHGEVETSRNTFNFKAASTSEEDSLGFLTLTKVNEKDPLHLEYKYDFKELSPSVNLIASYGESRKYAFYAGLPNDREITAKLAHEYYGKHSLDSLLTMKLNTSQLLWVKILWKKELYPQFYKAIFEEYNDLRFVIEATGKELIDVINDDIGKVLINDLSDMKHKIITYAQEEKKKFIEDFTNNRFTCPENNYICDILNDSKILEIYGIIFGPIKQFFYELHQNLEQSDWFSSIQYTFDVVSAQIERTLKDIKNIKNIKINAKDILKRGISDARKSLKEMETIAIKLLNDFDNYISYLKDEIEEFFEPFLNLLDDLVAYVEQRLALLQIAVLDIMDKILYYVYNLRETKEMLLVYSSYINWLEELHVTDVLEPLADVIEEILDTIITDVKKVTEHYKPYLDALSEALFGKYDGINELPPITEFREFVTRFYHKTIWIWNYHNMTETLIVFIQRLSNDIDDVLLFIELDESNGDFENHIGQADYIFRPEMGLIEVSQPLWFEWVAFNKPPSFETHPLYQKIQRKTDQFVKIYKSRYDLIDGLESLLEDLSEPTVAPATHNFAMVIGKNYFTTFNNHYYNFISNCSYLLASDFKTNSFSLLVNYHKENNEVKRTFEILTGGGSIVIEADYLISLDGKRVNLPLIYQHVTILKEYESIVIESTKGFKMICNSHYDFCTIQLSGWLFGKTAGLLGTLDNEKVTDTNTSNGTETTSLQEFTNSWKLQEQCALEVVQNEEKPQIPKLNGLMGKLCNLFFINKNSPLSECFDVIPPKPYLEMCLEYIQDQTKTAMCTSIAAYKVRCRKAAVHLEMPELCVQCEDDIAFREKIFDGHNPKSLDIVFITQQNCFDYNMSLPQSLNEQLRNNGYSNNKFASIGFGGNTLTKPHVYTTENGDVWNDEHIKIKYKYGYKRMNLPPFKAVDAIKYASNLNFRPGISKLFILLQCDATTEMENAPQIYNMLGEKDITLHIIKPKPLGNFSSDNYAIDGFGHVLSNFDVPANADEVISQIDDVYSGLALTTNGTIYDSDYIHGDVTNWTNFVVRTVKKSPCQKCKCVPDSNGVGKVECTRCLNPAVKQFLNEYESNNKMRFGNTDITDE